MEDAVQKRSQLINVIVQKAHKESEKLGKVIQTKQEREESKKSKHQIMQERISQNQANKERQSKDIVLKAKSHNEKALGVIKTKQEKEAQALLERQQGLQQKLNDAQSRKETMTKKKIETA